MHHTFFYISLPSLHNYDVKMPNFTFMVDVNKRGIIFFLLYLNLSAIPKKFTRYILTLSLNWNKHAKKNTQIHFKSDVFAAIAVVDAEAPLVS